LVVGLEGFGRKALGRVLWEGIGRVLWEGIGKGFVRRLWEGFGGKVLGRVWWEGFGRKLFGKGQKRSFGKVFGKALGRVRKA
jgi:hypothetical protein